MHQVGEGIYRLGTVIHNFYVIAEGGKATVVDAGCSKEFPKLELNRPGFYACSWVRGSAFSAECC